MTQSYVNGNNINADFPLAGQNNSSQGFRDNFAATKSGLNRAGTELSELRERVLVKSAIPGTSLNNDLNYTAIVRAQLKSNSDYFYNNGSAGANFTLDFNRGNWQKIILNQTCNFTFVNFPGTDNIGTVRLWIEVLSPAFKINLPLEVVYGVGAEYISSNQVDFPVQGNYLIDFIGVNSGLRFWIVPVLGLQEFTNGSGGGGASAIGPATVAALGLVRVDGNTIDVTSEGVISVIGGTPSDRDLKENIKPLEDPLTINRALNGVSFVYRDSQQPSIGLIAQDVELVLPELVSENSNGYKSVQYSNMAGLFVECIKRLEDRVRELEEKLQDLESRS